MTLERRPHTGQDLEAKALFVAQTVGAALDDANFVMRSDHERCAVSQVPQHVSLRLEATC
jgi:hypothetical protein